MAHSSITGIDQLDRARLQQLYEGDTDMLVSSIEMFLDEVFPNFSELESLIDLQDWVGVSVVTHQLRPWLGMVGLTGLENKLWEIEKQAKKNPDQQMLRNDYFNFEENLANMLPVLKTELQLLTK